MLWAVGFGFEAIGDAQLAAFVAAKTGKPMLERSLLDTKPGYGDYIRRASGFFPRPPRTD